MIIMTVVAIAIIAAAIYLELRNDKDEEAAADHRLQLRIARMQERINVQREPVYTIDPDVPELILKKA